MSGIRAPMILIGLAVVALSIPGCKDTVDAPDVVGTTSSTPAPTTTSPSASTPSTASLSATTTTAPSTTASTFDTAAGPVASFEDIVGAYEKPVGEFGYLEISGDGTLVWAGDRNDPDQITLTSRFEDATLVITDPDCGQEFEGRYEIHLVEAGSIDLVLVEDSCSGRAGLIPGVYNALG